MRILIILLFLLVSGLAPGSGMANAKPMSDDDMSAGQISLMPASKPVELQLAMRVLWEDHILFTRNYIISALAGLPDSDAIAQRLLTNQDEIGAAIKPFYGEAAGDMLSGLLREHIMLAVDVVGAAKRGDGAAVEEAQAQWHANADEIAAFLSSANPNWDQQELTEMLYKHLELTTGEAVARLKQDWAADIRNSDLNHVHMMMMADALTAGIVKQFPEMFE